MKTSVATTRLAATERGLREGRPLVFAHGFGCDQRLWRYVTTVFEDRFRVVVYDHAGCGGATAAWDRNRHATLDGYADDLLELCDELGLEDVVVIGHSVAATIAVLAHLRRPYLINSLVLVGPSPCYVDDGGYRGGFSATDIEELLEGIDKNFLGWSAAMAPVIMGNPDRPELAAELEATFCRNDPAIAKVFAAATFRGDHRDAYRKVRCPTLVIQCTKDAIAPVEVGEWVHHAIPGSELALIDAVGHCPNLSHPTETASAIERFLRSFS